MNIIERLRANLKPTGTAPVVQLQTANYGMFNSDFVSKCIDEIERMNIRIACGDKPTALEQLAIQLLLDSAYIDLLHEKEISDFFKEN